MKCNGKCDQRGELFYYDAIIMVTSNADGHFETWLADKTFHLLHFRQQKAVRKDDYREKEETKVK